MVEDYGTYPQHIWHQVTGQLLVTVRSSILAGVDLAGADLPGARLAGARLTGADLTWANLAWADLAGADLTGARLAGADLPGARLAGARLTGADLTGADLTWANLAWADLAGARLAGARLTGADLTGADLTGARLAGARLTRADLGGTCLDPAAAIPPISDDQLKQDDLEVCGNFVFGWRTARSKYVGSTGYRPGRCYKAHAFSVDTEECHPGIFLAGSGWFDNRVVEYGEDELVRCFCRRDELHHAGDKYRCKRLWIVPDDFKVERTCCGKKEEKDG